MSPVALEGGTPEQAAFWGAQLGSKWHRVGPGLTTLALLCKWTCFTELTARERVLSPQTWAPVTAAQDAVGTRVWLPIPGGWHRMMLFGVLYKVAASPGMGYQRANSETQVWEDRMKDWGCHLITHQGLLG